MQAHSTADPPVIDYSTPFRFLLNTPDGRNALLIGGLCLMGFFLLLIPPLIALGWLIQLSRNVARGSEELPPWKFSYIGEALRLWGATLLLIVPMYVVFFGLILIPGFLAESRGSEVNPFPFTAGMLLMFGLMNVYIIAVVLLFPAIFAVFAVTGRFSDCFSPALIKSVIQRHGWPYLGVAAICYGVSSLAGLGMFLCCVGFFFTTFYVYALEFHFSGQLARALMPPAAPSPWIDGGVGTV